MDLEALRQQLAESRAELIASLAGASETDFNAQIQPEVTVIAALARLADDERATVIEARRLVGVPPRPTPVRGSEPARRLTPPPVVHDLAGARHETNLLLDALSGTDDVRKEAHEAAVHRLVVLVRSEHDLARRIRAELQDRETGEPPA